MYMLSWNKRFIILTIYGVMNTSPCHYIFFYNIIFIISPYCKGNKAHCYLVHQFRNIKKQNHGFVFMFWDFFFLSFFFYKFYFIFKLCNIVLVLPNIEMNLPQVYLCSPSWTLFFLSWSPLKELFLHVALFFFFLNVGGNICQNYDLTCLNSSWCLV